MNDKNPTAPIVTQGPKSVSKMIHLEEYRKDEGKRTHTVYWRASSIDAVEDGWVSSGYDGWNCTKVTVPGRELLVQGTKEEILALIDKAEAK